MAANISFMFRPLQARPMREFQKESEGGGVDKGESEKELQAKIGILRKRKRWKERGSQRRKNSNRDKGLEKNRDRESHKAIKVSKKSHN